MYVCPYVRTGGTHKKPRTLNKVNLRPIIPQVFRGYTGRKLKRKYVCYK